MCMHKSACHVGTCNSSHLTCTEAVRHQRPLVKVDINAGGPPFFSAETFTSTRDRQRSQGLLAAFLELIDLFTPNDIEARSIIGPDANDMNAQQVCGLQV